MHCTDSYFCKNGDCMAEKIAEDLWQLSIPLKGNPLKNLNSYLIVGERSLLIDTGFRWDSCRLAMERELSVTGVNRDKMDIFITHFHSDHAGLTPDLLHPGCHAYIGRIDGENLIDYMADTTWKRVYAGYVKEGFPQGEIDCLWNANPAQSAAPTPWNGYTYIDDGDMLSYGEHTLQCILTPGHTPGHLCLYDKDKQWLFSGDHILFHITPNICRWETMPDALGSYLESLNRVRNLPVKLLLPAHRSVSDTLANRVDSLAAHHRQRIEAVRNIVQNAPGLTAYEITAQMRWNIHSRSWSEFPLIQKYFAVGEALAHLDYLSVREQLKCREVCGEKRYYVQ